MSNTNKAYKKIRDIQRMSSKEKKHRTFIMNLGANNPIKDAIASIKDVKEQEKIIEDCIRAGSLSSGFDLSLLKNAYFINLLNLKTDSSRKESLFRDMERVERLENDLVAYEKAYVLDSLLDGYKTTKINLVIANGFFKRANYLLRGKDYAFQMDFENKTGYKSNYIINKIYSDNKKQITIKKLNFSDEVLSSGKVYEELIDIWEYAKFRALNYPKAIQRKISQGIKICSLGFNENVRDEELITPLERFNKEKEKDLRNKANLISEEDFIGFDDE